MSNSNLNKLKRENEIVFLQLEKVQDELEKYFLKFRELESRIGLCDNRNESDLRDEMVSILSDRLRLEVACDMQRDIYFISNNSICLNLGEVIIDGFKSLKNFFNLPFALYIFWKSDISLRLPKKFKGEGFEKLVSICEVGSITNVIKIINNENLSRASKSILFTDLSRIFIKRDPKAAAESSLQAYILDPKMYRLKWLMFRLHESGEVLKAEALIDLIGDKVNFSESEIRVANIIRLDASRMRTKVAKEKVSMFFK